MVRFLLAALSILVSFIYLWPLAHRAFTVKGVPLTCAGVLAITFGLSTGMLSLYMLALGLLPGDWIRPMMVLPAPWLLFGLGIWRTKRVPSLSSSRQALIFWLTLICAAGFMIIAVNTVSYPFYRYDVLARFAPNARLLFDSRSVPVTLIGYPLGVQMLYAFAFIAYGAVNDHLAGIVVAAFSAAMLLTTFAVGRVAFSRRTGWLAVLLLLSSLLFVDWSTSGYVDVPVGVYHGLTFLCAFIWLESGERRWALLAGLMAGLALWTKQSALVLIPALAVVPLLRILSQRETWLEIRSGMIALGAVLLLAGPWYLRSMLIGGPTSVLPAPGAYDAQLIDRSLSALITFGSASSEWGPWLSPAAVLGIILWATHFWKPVVDTTSHSPINRRRRAWLLGAFIIPYHIIWWQGFSYQTRYLLASAPLYAVLAGHGIDWLLGRLPALLRTPNWAILAAAGVMVFTGTSSRLGAVYHLAVHPLQSDDAKLSRLSEDSWSLVKHIRATIEPGASILAMDGALAYWLHKYHFKQGYPFTLADLQGYDYFITSASGESVYRFYDALDNEVLGALGNTEHLPEIYRHNKTVAVYHVGPVEQ
ncbi:MAG: glycosyltransferase family 39 protein [Anaerolineales bacterium]|nr:glycosyltransferase family 39 protein [Anaerolineales bacterium]